LPVCVHRGPGSSGPQALSALHALEDAYERLVQVLALPAPLPDDGHGGSDALDWYVGDGQSALVTERDAVELAGLDRAAGFCIGGASDPELIRRDATLCLGEAIAKRLDPAETPA